MDQNRLALLALHFIPGIGDHLIKQLISYCGSPERVFSVPKGKLMNIPGVGRATTEAIRNREAFHMAEDELTRCEKLGVSLIFYWDDNYPSRLKQIGDAPTILYTRGIINFETKKTVGIIGTRRATDYGRQCTAELVAGLVPHQALIVSGLAYGIDIHAHREAVRHNLPTIGIMGSGIDVIYPAAHTDVVRKMMQCGGIVTENPFHTKPDAHNFPARNRIIAGLSDAVVVVEAAEKGGALITVDIANSYNKDVFAFPGDIGRSFSVGCNNLIKSNSAHLITGIQDLERMMNWDTAPSAKPAEEQHQYEGLNDDEQSVVTILRAHQNKLRVDELSWRSGIVIGKMASVLIALELKGVIKAMPGKVYQLN